MTQFTPGILSAISLSWLFTMPLTPLRADEPFRPEAGNPPPIENAHTYLGELITEGIRPTRVVRIRPDGWPDVHLPREEYLQDRKATHDDRFPSPAI